MVSPTNKLQQFWRGPWWQLSGFFFLLDSRIFQSCSDKHIACTSIVLVVYPSGIHSTSHFYKHLIGNFMKHIPIYIYIYVPIYIYMPINIPINVFQYDNGQMNQNFGAVAWPLPPLRQGGRPAWRARRARRARKDGVSGDPWRAVMEHLMVIHRDLMVI